MDAPHGLHLHLKLTTAAAHSALEHLLATRGYFDSREGYVDYLQRFLAFQSEAEQLLDTAVASQVIPDWNERRRAHLARADLQTLGAEEGYFLRSSGRLPDLVGSEQILGIAYVLEGSTLGGAFLLRQLAPLGISPIHGGSYLTSYGADRSRMWRRFCETLEEANSRRFCADSVASAALAAFAAARYYLTEAEPGVGTALARATVSRTAAIHT